ncbi:MAG: hypothetical protein HOB40_03460 [Candidatus Marinimicrobia bacterium]|jgi:hypothetical protein|nr:hypothetical protein [Candidatus Neomarinimicrobiota bacterium]MBT3839051.1 hypothetical protein [Candidatus Neomarinimicrobiota bacterium]MBT3999274.1 hypothetical protein [Candidatus Neomarinimicrobiota bacterium]MBT4282774.1 hypothetical protein [Candidatus Neomarinimicrobiota bacterium]MBT4578338.1 hypothetical protein [Candidatus Neomarinimicrobiota bacterium]
MIFSPITALRGIILWLLLLGPVMSQEMPTIELVNSESIETGIKLNFYLSQPIKRSDIAGWIEQDNWFILNFYNIIKPDSGFMKNVATYPIQDIQQVWTQNSIQLSIQIGRKIGSSDVVIHDNGTKVLVVITYADYIQAKDVNPSFVFPNPKDAQKISHPSSWKDARERTTLNIICDTKGLPIYVDNQLVGNTPLDHGIDVLPGWHKVGYFPDNYSEDLKSRTSKEKMLNDILVMGRLDVYIEEGKEETIVLNYQTLDEDVVDYNKKFQTGAWTGFSLFFLLIILMSWGLA